MHHDIEDSKDNVAIKKGYPDWETMENFIIDNNNTCDAKKAISDSTRIKMSKAKSGSKHPMFGLRGSLNPKFGKRYPK